MQEITTKEMINRAEYWLELERAFHSEADIEKAIVAKLKEAKQREGKCRWKVSPYNAEIFNAKCNIHIQEFYDPDNVKYCKSCSREIEWVEEK